MIEPLPRDPPQGDATPDPATRPSRRAVRPPAVARRWLAWRYVVASVLLVALVVGGVWLVFFSSLLAVKQVEVAGRPAAQRRAGSSRRPHVPTGEQLARVDLGRDPRPGRGAGRGTLRRRLPRSGPTAC